MGAYQRGVLVSNDANPHRLVGASEKAVAFQNVVDAGSNGVFHIIRTKSLVFSAHLQDENHLSNIMVL